MRHTLTTCANFFLACVLSLHAEAAQRGLVRAEDQEWFPQIPVTGVKNFIPNSSFECGAANWGSFSDHDFGWQNGLYKLEGEVVPDKTAPHGNKVFKLALNPSSLPVSWFDYHRPFRRETKTVMLANLGWFKVQPGSPLTLSAFVRCDKTDTPVEFLARQSSKKALQKTVLVSTNWSRHEFTFSPATPFLFIAIGLAFLGATMLYAIVCDRL